MLQHDRFKLPAPVPQVYERGDLIRSLPRLRSQQGGKWVRLKREARGQIFSTTFASQSQGKSVQSGYSGISRDA